MARPYLNYVARAMRYYARYKDIQESPTSPADILNWECCEATLSDFEDQEQRIILDLYRERDTFPDNVYQASMKYRMPQDSIWKLNTSFMEKFAERRGLI